MKECQCRFAKAAFAVIFGSRRKYSLVKERHGLDLPERYEPRDTTAKLIPFEVGADGLFIKHEVSQ